MQKAHTSTDPMWFSATPPPSTTADGCCIVYVTAEGNEELEACSDFKAVEDNQMEVITLSDLMDAYEKVHGVKL